MIPDLQLILVSGVDPLARVGGHESYVVGHALAAAAAGFSPQVFHVGERDSERTHQLVSLRGIASPARPFRGIMVAAHAPFLTAGIRRYLRQRPGPVVVHGFGVWADVAARVQRALRAEGRRVVAITSAYTTMKHEYREKLNGLHPDHGPRQHLRHWREYLIVRLSSARRERRGYAAQRLVLVNYEAVREQLIADYRLAVEVRRLPYAAPAAFRDAEEAPPMPAEIAALRPAEAPLVVSVSRHDPRKGVDVLLRALARLQAAATPFRACLVSDGALLAAHRKLAAKLALGASTALPGRVDDPFAHLRHADIFVLPSIQEGSGSLSLLEALQAGCAVVSSRCDGLPEDLVDGANALLVPCGDDAALAAALARLLTDPALRQRLARSARATFEQRFSAPAFTTALGATYDELSAPLA